MTQMLNFAAAHGVKPTVEVYPFAEVNTALAGIAANTTRFRAVLRASTNA